MPLKSWKTLTEWRVPSTGLTGRSTLGEGVAHAGHTCGTAHEGLGSEGEVLHTRGTADRGTGEIELAGCSGGQEGCRIESNGVETDQQLSCKGLKTPQQRVRPKQNTDGCDSPPQQPASTPNPRPRFSDSTGGVISQHR